MCLTVAGSNISRVKYHHPLSSYKMPLRTLISSITNMNTNHTNCALQTTNTCEALTSTITLRPEEEFNPQYCTQCDQTLWSIELVRNHLDLSGRHPYCGTCKRGFLNNNSFKMHLILSDYHHYCDDCDKEFQSSSALKIQSACHHRDYEEGDREKRADGWEDELARQQQEENREDPLALEKFEEDAPMSRVEVGIAILNLKKRLQRQPIPKATLKQTCPVCLCPSSKMSVTKCGHVFCSSCIRQTFEKSQGCPSCRKPGHLDQLRKIDLHIL
ncbi:hypothetical protein EDD85DRAFT_143970 [Armillaria nabsnona]|nr:hypothetical protein EDD85DRAFT_143970 [Armillaria nabsnona]